MMKITSCKGALLEVVYDLSERHFESSGTPDPVPLSVLAAKSLFWTRPALKHYTITRDELLQTASAVFTDLAAGVLRVRVNHTYPLSQAAQAHADLESRKTSGSVVLIPDGH
ncbi:UNVERIFIED_CONTAM: putative quinone oxidoreductase [Sesamum latifolium]|uniref:Quinone oxidoreductase n=1 Tax=Sesamum latifolium TaxID=2727402 RepID=A0AAW2T7V1_9LAMI